MAASARSGRRACGRHRLARRPDPGRRHVRRTAGVPPRRLSVSPTSVPCCRSTPATRHARRRATAACGSRSSRSSTATATSALVAGEYGDGSRAPTGAARFSLDGEVELHEPGLYRMQGIVIVDGTWYVTTSNGERRPRRPLGRGTRAPSPATATCCRPAPRTSPTTASTRRLWSLSEWPGRRRVFQIDPTPLAVALTRREPHPPQQLRVERDHDRRHRHHGGADRRRHQEPDAGEHTRRDRQPDRVVAGRPDQVLQHLAIRRARAA